MTDQLTTDEIEELLRLADKATPGPWEIHEDSAGGKDEVRCFWRKVGPYDIPGKRKEPDDEFIAASRQAVPSLAREVLRLRERVRELESAQPQ